ncbi:cyclic nucleotide-binding-like protein [Blastocladiella britannica]|nr:cyclic nucleotide-binding-like protein [Blastocladiella britannica]
MLVLGDKNIPKISLYISRLIKNFVLFLYLSHLDACIFWAICYWENSPLSWINTFGLGVGPNGSAVPFGTQYLASYLAAQEVMFFSFRTITLGPERIYCIVEVILGSLVNGSIFGNIANLVVSMQNDAALDQKLQKQNYRMLNLRKFMRDRKFPVEIQKKVRQHNEMEWVRNHGLDEGKLFGDLPLFLKQELWNHLHMDSLNGVPVFRNCTDHMFKAAVARVMSTVMIQDDFCVFRAGDEALECFFVRMGAVELLDELGHVKQTIQVGGFFGDEALYGPCQRRFAARTTTTTEVGVLARPELEHVLADFPKVAATFVAPLPTMEHRHPDRTFSMRSSTSKISPGKQLSSGIRSLKRMVSGSVAGSPGSVGLTSP